MKDKEQNEMNNATKAVRAIGKINFIGNIIPINWYHNIRFESGKCDLAAVNILAEIVYWYRPTLIRDEQSGEIIGYKKKFKSDMLQKSFSDFAELLGLTKNQSRRACKNLERLALIKTDLRDITIKGLKLNNVMFVEPIFENIKAITNYPPMQLELDRGVIRIIQPHNSNDIAPQLESHTYTEITQESTSKITTQKKEKEFCFCENSKKDQDLKNKKKLKDSAPPKISQPANAVHPALAAAEAEVSGNKYGRLMQEVIALWNKKQPYKENQIRGALNIPRDRDGNSLLVILQDLIESQGETQERIRQCVENFCQALAENRGGKMVKYWARTKLVTLLTDKYLKFVDSEALARTVGDAGVNGNRISGKEFGKLLNKYKSNRKSRELS